MDNKKEYIICAAIKRLEPRIHPINPERKPYKQSDIMYVELGFRHHDILIRFHGEVSKQQDDQGFYTSKNRFVSREEGIKIALKCGQIESSINDNVLFSEDLY